MFPPNDGRRCAFCKVGSLIKSDREIAFKQRTEKGYLFCRVTIPMEICDNCRSQTWDADAEAMINEAVREQYKKMP
jgi:hypothetical protein